MSDEKKSKEQLINELTELRQRVAEFEALETQYEQMKQDYRESEQRLNSIINSVPDIIYKLDDQGRIVFISDAIKKYGYTPEELIGTHILDLVHPENRDEAKYKVNERRAGERRTRSLEVRFLTKEQVEVPFEVKSSSIENEPVFTIASEGLYRSPKPEAQGFIGTQGVARDITERKQMEEILQEAERTRVLIETAGAAAHEINQPLQVAMGASQLLLTQMAPDAPQRHTIESICKAAERISEIVQKMQNIRQYAAQHYVEDRNIIDFDAAQEQQRKE